jgi:hypothetical protein
MQMHTLKRVVLLISFMVYRYKARPAYESVLEYLDAEHEKQVAAGLTLASNNQ